MPKTKTTRTTASPETIATLATRAAVSLRGHGLTYGQMVEHAEWHALAQHFAETAAAYLPSPGDRESVAQGMAFYEIGKAIGAQRDGVASTFVLAGVDTPVDACDKAFCKLAAVEMLMDHASQGDLLGDDGAYTLWTVLDMVRAIRSDLRKTVEAADKSNPVLLALAGGAK